MGLPSRAPSRVGGGSPQQGQGYRQSQAAVDFNWPWHTLDNFLRNKLILLIISLINRIISGANI